MTIMEGREIKIDTGKENTSRDINCIKSVSKAAKQTESKSLTNMTRAGMKLEQTPETVYGAINETLTPQEGLLQDYYTPVGLMTCIGANFQHTKEW